MDYSDRFHPTEGNDIDDYDINSKQIYTIQDLKSLDKNFHKYKKMVTIEDEDGFRLQKKTVISYYSSGPCGNYIRDAQTGVFTKHIVGSKYEDLYFKVNLTDASSMTLYYDSPEKYEKHHYEKLSNDTKERWLKKRLLFEKNNQ